jgi:hypothetical protein
VNPIDIRESSVSDSLPVELYEFLGSYKNYHYTSAAEAIVFQGQTYLPVAGLTRTNIKAGTNTDDNVSAKVTIPVKSDIVADYGFQITPPRLQLTVYRIYRDLTPYESNFRIYWKGPVMNISIKGRNAIFEVPSIFGHALGAACPSTLFQTPCNFVLFDPTTCKVPRAANSVSANVQSFEANGQVLVLDAYGSFSLTDFIGGEIFIPSQNERRMVIGVDSSNGEITVNYPFGRVSVGIGSQITRGCDHDWLGHCKTRYNNTKNFGGHPLIPSLNIFETGF